MPEEGRGVCSAISKHNIDVENPTYSTHSSGKWAATALCTLHLLRHVPFTNMIVFKDLISSDEMMTDAFPQKPVIDDDGNQVEGLFEVESAMMVKGADNVDIGCGDAFGGAEEVDDSAEKVNNVIDSFKYTEIPFSSKTELRDYLKDYMKSVRAKLKEKGTPQPEIKQFMAQAPAICKFLLGKFSDMQTFAGESMTSEGGMAFGYYKEGAHNPTFVYISKALDAEKF